MRIINNDLAFPDGTRFYPDIKNGKRGFNTDPARGADTFYPFRQSPILLATDIDSFNSYSYICTNLPEYPKLTADNFLMVIKRIQKTANSLSDTGNIVKTYDATTGRLTINKYFLASGLKFASGSNLTVSVIYDLYLIS